MKLIYVFIKQAFYSMGAYRISFWLNFLYIFVMLYCTNYLWTTLYAGNNEMFSVSLIQMKTYGLLGIILQASTGGKSNPQWYIADQVRKGTIEMDVIKPIDFQLLMFLRSFGIIFLRFCLLSIPAMAISIISFRIKVPSIKIVIYFAVSFFIGILISYAINFIIGIFCVVTLNIQNMSWAYSALNQFFSGQMVPLWLFPGFLIKIANALPFRCMYAIPMSIFIGKNNEYEILNVLCIQIIWAFSLLLLGHIIWVIISKKIIIQGG